MDSTKPIRIPPCLFIVVFCIFILAALPMTATAQVAATRSSLLLHTPHPPLQGYGVPSYSSRLHSGAGNTVEYPTLTANSQPTSITIGPDGNYWFTEYLGNAIGNMLPYGRFSEYPIPTSNSGPNSITDGPDGNEWFTEVNGNKIGRMTPNGRFSEYSIPTPNSRPDEITSGPKGTLWFTEYNGNKIGSITISGKITEYSIPTPNSAAAGITADRKGTLWFTEYNGNKIGKITTSGKITEYSIPTPNSSPYEITADSAGTLWFTQQGTNSNTIGRMTPKGKVTEFHIPTANSDPWSIKTGYDGNLWFTEFLGNKIGMITPLGKITEYPISSTNSGPMGLVPSLSGTIGFVEAHLSNLGLLFAYPACRPGFQCQITLSPNSGPVEGLVAIIGNGFQAGATITFYFGQNTQAAGQVTADNNGNFVSSFHVPQYTPAGSYTVVATSSLGGGGYTTFQVVCSITLTPSQGPVGSTFTVASTSYCFLAWYSIPDGGGGVWLRENISIYFGGMDVSPPGLMSDIHGNFTSPLITVPSVQPGNSYTVEADGSPGFLSVTAQFVVTG